MQEKVLFEKELFVCKVLKIGSLFFLIVIHSMQGWTATTKHGVTKKEEEKRLQDTENL